MRDNELSRCTPRDALGLLLESFARANRYVPEHAHAVTDPAELPSKLRPFTVSHSALATWRAWVDEPRLWFIMGRLSNERCGHSRDSLLLEMLFLSGDGQAVAAGCWGLSPQGCWELRRVHEPDTTRIASQPLQWRQHARCNVETTRRPARGNGDHE